MRQSIITDPGGERVIRIVSGIRPVNGSVLIVPAETIAYFVLNGIVSEPYSPGRHIINTGVNPFFVRISNLMTGGIPAITVSVVFVSPNIVTFSNIGINDLAFTESTFGLHIHAMGSCVIGYKILNTESFIRKLVGMYSSIFTQEEVEPSISALVMPIIKTKLSIRLSNSDISNVQNELIDIGNSIRLDVEPELSRFGLDIVSLGIQGINIKESDINRFQTLEDKRAQGRVEIGVDEEELDRIYGGDVMKRMLEGAMTGTVRGRGLPNTNGGANNSMPNMYLQMMMMSQMMGAFREPMTNMFNGSNIIGGSGNVNSSTNNENRDRPLAGRPLPANNNIGNKVCRNCGAKIAKDLYVCPICKLRT